MLDEDKVVALFASQYWLMRKNQQDEQGRESCVSIAPPIILEQLWVSVLFCWGIISWAGLFLVLWGAAINDF